METDTHTHTDTHTDTQNDYRNPRCACAPRVKNEVDIGPAAGRAFRGYWSGNRVYSPYTVRDTLTFDSR